MRKVAVIFFVLSGNCALAVASEPEVDVAEVLRWGDVVQTVGDEAGTTPVDVHMAALAPPASDADKWFISLITTKGCPECEQLKRDWANDPWLLALAIPEVPHQSWAHFNVYLHEDPSQAFRFDDVSITSYPTILVQPPRSNKFGDPKTVVFQGVYGGDPRKLAEAVTQSISQYVASLRPAEADRVATADDSNRNPPWLPADASNPRATDPNGRARLDRLLQLIPPREPAFPWSLALTALTAGMSIPTAAALLAWAILFARAKRQAAGKPPLLDPAKLDRLVELLQALAEGTPPPPFRRP